MPDSHTQTGGESIELIDVTKQYRGQDEAAVEEISMTIPAGEIVALVGPSGCGKTTTMKMINRLIEPTSGRITIGGADVLDLDPDEHRRRIGYVIQQTGLFPHMRVADNIGLVPKMLGWDKTRIRARVEELLELVGLPGDFAQRYPRELSGGQQQRIGVARALAADPPVMLMDEPFGATDPITRERLQDEFLRLQTELRKTIVFVTHDFEEAVKVGDRIAVLRARSVIAQYDTPAALLAAPADDYVQGFIGTGGHLKQLGLVPVRELRLDPADRLGDTPPLAADASSRDALDAMLGYGVDALPVTEDGTPHGSLLGQVTLQTVRQVVRRTGRAEEPAS